MAKGNTPGIAALKRGGVPFEVHEYPPVEAGDESYGEAVAAALGVDPERMFKTLIALVDGSPVVAIVPTSRQLSLKALASAVGGKRAKLAESTDAERWSGYVVGGISPFGQKKRLKAWADASIERFETVFVSAGQRGLQLEIAPSELLKAAPATAVSGLATGR